MKVVHQLFVCLHAVMALLFALVSLGLLLGWRPAKAGAVGTWLG